MTLADKIFPHLFITCFSYHSNETELNLYKALAIEHHFCGIVADSATITEYDFFDNKTFLAINFPYIGHLNSSVIKSIIDPEIPLDQIGGLFVSVNRFDVTNGRWNVIREFLKELDGASQKPIYIALDVHWLHNPQDLAKFFSLVDPYQHLFPVISCYTFIKRTQPADLVEWCKIAKNSSIKPVTFFGPPPVDSKFLLELIKTGFTNIGMPANLAVNFITTI